jgi:hypothetical protein
VPSFRYLILFALFWAPIADAGLHKCTEPDGSTRYSDRPCAADEKAESTAMPGMGGGAAAGSGDLKIDHTWMAPPSMLPSDWTCDTGGCLCNGRHEALDVEPSSRLINALGNLSNSWRNHLSSLRSWNQRGGAQNTDAAGMRSGVSDSACRVANQQWVVRQLHPALTKTLLESHEHNEYLAKTLESRCRKPEETGWTQSEEAKEYVRCLNETRSQRNEAVRASRQTGSTERALRQALSELGFPRSDAPR